MILALVAAAFLQSEAVPAAPPVIQPKTVTLRAGTPIRFVTEAAIDSRFVRQGQRFTIVVSDDVVDRGTVTIAKGTRAVGEVEVVTEKGMFGKPGGLVLRPLFIELGGTRINLEGIAQTSGKEQVGGAAVATVLTGGLGLIITGKSAQMPAGSELMGMVRNNVTVAIAR